MNQREVDFRLVKPIYRFNKFHNKSIFIIGCKVINVKPVQFNEYRFKATVERVDYKTGAIIKDIAYMRHGVYGNLGKMIFDVPYNMQCLKY